MTIILTAVGSSAFRKERFSEKESQNHLLNGKQSLRLHGVERPTFSQPHNDKNLGPQKKEGKKRKNKNLKDPCFVYFNTKFMKHSFINVTRELNY